jgi:hypothetical protein
MDIALITANANQLRYVLEFGEPNRIFYTITVLIVLSILLQVQPFLILDIYERYVYFKITYHENIVL